jgi:hypothetical protein
LRKSNLIFIRCVLIRWEEAADLATLCLFRDAPYLTETAATVLEVQDRGGIILDKTVFSTSLEAVSRSTAAYSSALTAQPLKLVRQYTATGSFMFQRRVLGAGSGASRSRQALVGNGDTDTCGSTRVCIC